MYVNRIVCVCVYVNRIVCVLVVAAAAAADVADRQNMTKMADGVDIDLYADDLEQDFAQVRPVRLRGPEPAATTSASRPDTAAASRSPCLKRAVSGP